MIRKRFNQYWIFECPDAIMTCSILNCPDKSLLTFGGHDKSLYLMSDDLMILDDVSFDGWARCSYAIDLDRDGYDEILVGTGDGRLIVLKLDKKNNTFNGIMNYKTEGMIDCCVAGDLYQDGNIELIIGGEGKNVQILKNVNSEEPIATLYYDSWVSCCTFGYLKLPKATRAVAALLIGTKTGVLQLIQVKNNKIDIVWQRKIYAEINDIKIGDVTNDGYNEIIVASDDYYIKIFDAEGKRVSYLKIEEPLTKTKKKRKRELNRPKTLLIEDIDGDKSKNIVIGCADGSLRVFHNPKLNSKDIQLKWRTSEAQTASIKGICSYMNIEHNLRHVIYGGYERTLRNISDFDWGKKEPLKIPQKFKIPINKHSEQEGKDTKIKTVPTNLRGFITKLLNSHGFFLTLDLLMNKLMEKGYEREEIEEEIEFLKSKNAMIFDKIDVNVWSLVNEEIDDVISHEIIDSKLITTKNPVSKKTAPKKTAPKKTAPKKTAPKKAAPKK